MINTPTRIDIWKNAVFLAVIAFSSALAELDSDIKEMIGEQVISTVCNDTEFLGISGMTVEECAITTLDILPACWHTLDPVLPNVQLGDGQISNVETKKRILGLREILAKCLQATVLVPDFSRQRQSEIKLLTDPISESRRAFVQKSLASKQFELDSWLSAIERGTADHSSRRDAVVAVEKALLNSDYDYVSVNDDDEVYYGLPNHSGLHQANFPEAERWRGLLQDADLSTVSKFEDQMSFGSRTVLKSPSRYFFVSYSFEVSGDGGGETLQTCSEPLEHSECGHCQEEIDSVRSIAFFWISVEAFNGSGSDAQTSSAGKSPSVDAFEDCWVDGLAGLNYKDESIDLRQ